MGLQGFLFTSDEGIAGTIRLLLTSLDVQGEFCSEATTAAERIANQSFQIVIIDWDNQPEAGLLLSAARQRKASERPITLAIVSDDASVPKALQAGANSVLRKPIVVNHAKDTLMTARDLLRAKREPGALPGIAKPTAGISAASAVPVSASVTRGGEKTLKGGEFLQSTTTAPGNSFETESDITASMHEEIPEPVDPLEELEPVASSVAKKAAAPEPPAPEADQPRGLEWYLKNKGIARPTPVVSNLSHAAAAAPAPAPAKPELLGFEQSSSHSSPGISSENETFASTVPASPSGFNKKTEEFPARVEEVEEQPNETAVRSFRLSRGTIAVLVIFAIGIMAALPQAPWHSRMKTLWAKGQRSLHTWLNPQPVTPAQAPVSHENFARAGDEYKLPAAEAIPDATTDPSQIQVVPVIDPTKKPTGDAANQVVAPTDGSVTTPADQPPAPAAESSGGSASQSATVPPQNDPATNQSVAPAPVTVPAANTPVHTETPTPVPAPVASVPVPAPVKPQVVRAPAMPEKIPSSLKSQIQTTTPDAGGSKSPDAAMPSIEPVAVAEGAERTLLIEQPAIAYPANLKTSQGTVVLQVLVGRDGTVQDAKFLQGSLAFARVAIDGVKQWKFKPYTMNGRAVSVQTLLTLTFKPAA
jgi:periplasmic protein TonB